MTLTLNLNPEVEQGLVARAQSRGVSLDVYVQELVAKEAALSAHSDSGSIEDRFGCSV